jgi:ATP-dependent DNA helicase RecQ
LRELTGNPNENFRSPEQAALIDYTLWTGSHLIGVLPTGCGKSMAFFLYAKVNPFRTSVVIVPTNALKDDLRRRAEAYGIQCCADWREFRGAGSVALLILNTEEYVLKDVIVLLHKLTLEPERCGRMFLDEAHVFFTDFDYRPNLRSLGHLIMFGRVVALTGSCSEACLADLKSNLFGPGHAPLVIRQATNRSNIAFAIKRCENEAGALDFVKREGDRLAMEPGPNKMVLYCPSRRMTEQLAAKLGGFYYHAEMDPGKQEEQRLGWLEGDNPILCATSAFGLGVDVHSVKSVFLWGPPYDLESYIQMSGRAGRDGSPAKSVLVTYTSLETKIKRYLEKSDPSRQISFDQMVAFAKSTRCLRRVITRAMDGLEVSCRTSGSLPCSHCLPLFPPALPQLPRDENARPVGQPTPRPLEPVGVDTDVPQTPSIRAAGIYFFI